MSDGVSPEKIADTLAAIDEFVRSSSAAEWTMPSDLLGSRVNGGAGKRCPMCRAHLVLREPRIYRRLMIPGGPVEALRDLSDEDVVYFDRIELLHRLFGESAASFASALKTRP